MVVAVCMGYGEAEGLYPVSFGEVEMRWDGLLD